MIKACNALGSIMRSVRVGLSFFLCSTAIATAVADSGIVVPPTEAIHGVSQVEWSRAWWQWAGSFDNDTSPVADRTGSLCASRQSGPVWFLAGTYGTRRTTRTCTVPRDTYVFFPLINYVVMPRGSAHSDCESVMRDAASMTDDPEALVLEIDGVRVDGLASHRQATKTCFDMGARTEGAYRIYPSAANGYYVMLRPMSPGKHVINFGGILPSMLQAVTYRLTVE